MSRFDTYRDSFPNARLNSFENGRAGSGASHQWRHASLQRIYPRTVRGLVSRDRLRPR